MKYAIFGFLFGTIGLFILSGLSLVSQIFELISTPFMWSGRTLSALLVGSEGSDIEVVLLTVANGILYAVIFYVGAKLFKKTF